MPIEVKIGSVLLSLVFFYIFIRLVRRQFINPFLLILWLGIGLVMLTTWPLHDLYLRLARTLGISDATYLIFIGAIFFLMIYSLYITLQISQVADRIQELISFTSILEQRIRKLQDEKRGDQAPS